MEEFIESFMSEESRLWQNMLGMRPGVEVDRMFFSVELSSIFRLYRVVNRGYYWLWYYDGLESEPRIFLALYDQSELLFRYLQQTFSSYEKKNQNLFHFISREKGGKVRFLATENAGEIFEMRRAAFRELSRGHLQMSQFVQDKQKWLSFFAESPLLGSYVMGFVSPEELYAPLAKIQKVFFGVQVFFLALMILSFILLSRLLLLPLAFLQKGLRSLLDGRYDSAVPVKMSDERGVCLNSFNFMNSELKQREKLMPFVAGQVLRLFSADDGSLRDFIQDEACVVFSDIRSFTTISEQQEPEKIVEMLNDYFTIWQSVVEKYDGIIERFIGDAIVVIFFRRFSERYAQDAVNSACEVMQALADFNHQRDLSGLFTIKNGIGVACGEIGFGILGDEKRRHFFAMGEAVKKAEELEAATKKGRFTHIFADSIVAEKLTELDFDFIQVTDLPENLLADEVFELSS
jgi:class 3 adenylate cyclase